MPTTLELTNQARASQLALGDELQAHVARTLPMLVHAGDYGRTWVDTVVPLVLAYRARSEALARQSYDAIRHQIVGQALPVPLGSDGFSAEDAARSLDYLGPGRLRKLVRQAELAGVDLTSRRVARAVGAGVLATASKHALDGGREATFRAVLADREALGYARLARPGACGFCAMLAGRGYVYRENTVTTSGSGTGFHSGCRCIPAPQFTGDQPLPGPNRQFEQMWADMATQGRSQRQLLAHWRRLVGETPGTRVSVP